MKEKVLLFRKTDSLYFKAGNYYECVIVLTDTGIQLTCKNPILFPIPCGESYSYLSSFSIHWYLVERIS